MNSQAHISKNRGSRLSKSKGSGHLLVQVFYKRREYTKRLEEIGELPRSPSVPLRTGYAQREEPDYYRCNNTGMKELLAGKSLQRELSNVE